jgi:ATP/maltotriose-dependent transcriptional regulator MalT
MDELPGSIDLVATFPFVGRVAELETLRAMLPRAEGEGSRALLIGGESGAGKSRLVREFSREAAADGAVVLYGACDAVVRTPYGPFVEALDQLARETDPDELRAALDSGGGELTRVIPDLPARIGELPEPVEADPDTERHRLHLAVSDLLAAISRRQPVLLVLEDGHWADGSTLLLLRHLARAPIDARLLLVATFRDTETDVPEALTETLADLHRADNVVRLRLAGLSGEEVTEFVRRAGGRDFDSGLDALTGTIAEITEGNPFLVSELWRALVETHAVEIADGTIRLTRPLGELATPESVREVVSQRLSRLEPTTIELLELAATAGPEFDFELIRRASGFDEQALLDGLDEAVRSALIEELPADGARADRDRGRSSGRLAFGFTHELVRRALYDRLTRLRRAELHLRVGEALESEAETSPRALADLAHHFAAAAPLGGSERGVEYNLSAARTAIATLAFDEAEDRLRTALDLPIEDPMRRAELLLVLGDASNRAGHAMDALEAFGSAAKIGREHDDAELFARAAIGYEDACWRPSIVDQGAVELLEEAAERLGDEDSGLRVGLLSGLARALDFRGERARGALVRGNAVALARRLRDRLGLAKVLVRSYWSRGTSSLDEILAMLSEAQDIGDELGEPEIRAEAMAWRVPTFVALGDLESARREVAALRETADQTAQPFILHVVEHYASALALCDGRLQEAEAMAALSHDWSRLLTGRDASGTYGIQMFSIRREQGRLAEVAPVLRVLAGGSARHGPWRPGLIALLADLGMEPEARDQLGRIADAGLEPLRETLWLASLTYLADASAALGDERVAALVYPELEPHSGSNVMIGHLVTSYGAADRYLGMLAATLGEWERAEEHLERALELNRRMGAKTWVAHTAYQYARLLHRRGRGRSEEAQALLREASSLADEIGLATLTGRIAEIGAPPPRAQFPDELSPREVQILQLVARGLSNREIGEALVISEHTAANHIRSILRKTGCANRTEAASYAHERGLVQA